MEPQNDRVINGLLKADIGLLTPEAVEHRLAQNVIIQADPRRASAGDLWPAIWFLAAVLERQFTGTVIIDAGLKGPLPAPIPLSPRCRFAPTATRHAGITVSIDPASELGTGPISTTGDARGNELGYGAALDSGNPAHPITACAIAGYLGFSALAEACGVPPFHAQWRAGRLALPFDPDRPFVPPDFSVLGTGQVGQAFLALAFFLTASTDKPSVHLVDKGTFEEPNLRTQVLLTHDLQRWSERAKVDYLAELCGSWGWTASAERTEINWGWRCKQTRSRFAFLGFDNMDARRVGAEGGFDWLFECGVGPDLCQPRVSWHSLPPDRQLAKRLFRDPGERRWSQSEFAKSLGETAGSCGRVTFENIDASAPSLGLVAAAFSWAEVLNYMAGDRCPYSGGAYAWSPLLPIDRIALIPSDAVRKAA
jgi:hypothetical protein